MEAGKLRYLVAIESQVTTRDSFGAQQNSWGTFATVYAGFQPLTGRELEAAQKINAEINSRVTIRYLRGLVPEMRVNWTDSQAGRNRIFDVLAVLDTDERHVTMDLLCAERYIPANAPAPGPATIATPTWGRKNFAETPDGVRTAFTLPGIPLASVLQIYVNGMLLSSPGDFTVAGAIVTFANPPAVGDQIFAYY